MLSVWRDIASIGQQNKYIVYLKERFSALSVELFAFCWTVLRSSWSQLRIEFNPVLSFRSIHYQCWLVAVLNWAAWVWEQRGNVTCKMVYRSKQTGIHCLCAEIIMSIRIRYKRASLFIYGLLGRNGGFIWKCVWMQNRSCDIDWIQNFRMSRAIFSRSCQHHNSCDKAHEWHWLDHSDWGSIAKNKTWSLVLKKEKIWDSFT